MSFVNYYAKEINCKIVYYGPAMGGKTTNIQHVHELTNNQQRGQVITLNTENERTLFFDFLPLDLGEIRGFKTRFHLYTVPGQSFYEITRKLVLRGVDGIVLVMDSQLERMEENQKILKDLEDNLRLQGIDPKKVPVVIQWNKRDMPNVASVQELSKKFNRNQFPEIEAVASKGEGVLETLNLISKKVLLNIQGGLN